MPFDPQPVLHGRLMTVRPLRPADFDALYAAGRDPLVWEQHPEPDRHLSDRFERYFAEALGSGGAMAVVAEDGTVIGTSRFHGYDPRRREVEIGWTFLARPYWGGATNGELKRLMLGHAFRFVDRVVFLVGPENHRSQRALAKIGARRAGTRLDQSGAERVVFEVRREDFPAADP